MIFFTTKIGSCSIYFLSHNIKWDPATTPIILPVFLHYAWLLGERIDFPFVKSAQSSSCFSERISCFTSNWLNWPAHPWHIVEGFATSSGSFGALTDRLLYASSLLGTSEAGMSTAQPQTTRLRKRGKGRRLWTLPTWLAVRQLLTPYLMHPFTSSWGRCEKTQYEGVKKLSCIKSHH